MSLLCCGTKNYFLTLFQKFRMILFHHQISHWKWYFKRTYRLLLSNYPKLLLNTKMNTSDIWLRIFVLNLNRIVERLFHLYIRVISSNKSKCFRKERFLWTIRRVRVCLKNKKPTLIAKLTLQLNSKSFYRPVKWL